MPLPVTGQRAGRGRKIFAPSFVQTKKVPFSIAADDIFFLVPNHHSSMADSSKDKVKGKVNEASGKVKEKVGEATNDPKMQDEGTAEKVKGKVQKKVGDIKKVFEK